MGESGKKENNETLYDRTIRRLKDKPIIVALLVIGAVIAALAQGITSLTKIKDTLFPSQPEIVEVNIKIQRFSSAGEYEGSPILLAPSLSDPKNMDTVADEITQAIIESVQPKQIEDFTANITINGNMLVADTEIESVLIAINSTGNIGDQTGQRIETANLLSGEDLSDRFNDPAFFDSECNCIQMELRPTMTGYKSVALTIYKSGDGFSFDPSSQMESTAVEFQVKPIIILVESLQGSGGTSEDLSAVGTILYGSIQKRLQKSGSIALSPFISQAEYQAEIEKAISSLPVGAGKQDYLNEHGIDYLVTITIVLK